MGHRVKGLKARRALAVQVYQGLWLDNVVCRAAQQEV